MKSPKKDTDNMLEMFAENTLRKELLTQIRAVRKEKHAILKDLTHMVRRLNNSNVW